MPRPRFLKLSEEKRNYILQRASAEFVSQGYQGASLNRLLEAAGISKGTFYYYFDDKDDLFGTVLQNELHFDSFAHEVHDANSPDEYWLAIDEWVDQIYGTFFRSPAAMSLARDLARLMNSAKIPRALIEMMEGLLKVMTEVLAIGQAIGAVRTDLPNDLLVSLVMKIGEAIDLWTLAHLDEVAAKSPEEMRRLSVPLFRRIVTPTGC